jgi:hypothetical protein
MGIKPDSLFPNQRLSDQVRANELATMNQRLQQQANEMTELLAQLKAANSQRSVTAEGESVGRLGRDAPCSGRLRTHGN